jgi:putative transposase
MPDRISMGWYITATGELNTCRSVTPNGWPSAGSRRPLEAKESYDNALAESIIGLYKTEVIRCRGPWRNVETVEFATLEWVDWFNNRRLLEPIGNVPPAEFEQAYYRGQEAHAMAA